MCFHCSFRASENGTYLLSGKSVHVPEDDDCPLKCRQFMQRPLDVRRRIHRMNIRRFMSDAGCCCFEHRQFMFVDALHLLHSVQRKIRDDAIKPRRKLRVAAKIVQRTIRTDKRVLRNVFCIVVVSDKPVSKVVRLFHVSFN